MSSREVKNITDYLRSITTARVGQQRSGSSLATHEILRFDVDHARARDAVHLPFNTEKLVEAFNSRGWQSLTLHSAAQNRQQYLQRPDFGRRLDDQSRKLLESFRRPFDGYDLAIMLSDGLSTIAIDNNAVPFLDVLIPHCEKAGWSRSPLVIAQQGRVALSDEIGLLLKARLSILLIGERPGLSAADSMGIYLTYGPIPGRTDAERNCISNIRRHGMAYEEAANLLCYLIEKALSKQMTGVGLKDESRLIGTTTDKARLTDHSSVESKP